MASNDGLYVRWVIANGVAEAVGLGTTFVCGMAVAPALMRASGVVEIFGGAALAVLLGMLLEGVLVGSAQAAVLRRHSSLPARSWVVATAVGAGTAWLLGMVPSTLMALLGADAAPGDAALREPGPLATWALAAGLGLLTGPILGLAQWRVLRRLPGAGHWLWANALAWAVGMPIIFAGMDLVPWDGPAVRRVVSIYIVCLVAGLVVGAVHGRVLVRLLASGEAGRPVRRGGA